MVSMTDTASPSPDTESFDTDSPSTLAAPNPEPGTRAAGSEPRTPTHGEAPPEDGSPLQQGEERRV